MDKIVPKTKPRKWLYAQRIEGLTGILMITPIIILMCVFAFYPILNSVYISFTKWDLLGDKVFVGIQNYIELFTDSSFDIELWNTIFLTFFSVSISMILSLVLANVLNTKMRAKGVYRVIYFLPNVTMPVAVGMVWQWMLNSQYGLVNQILSWVGIQGPKWISDPNWIKPGLIIVNVWMTVGYNLVILMGGLAGISETYYEAADIDGASAFTKFRRITLPLLSPYTFFLVITGIINALKIFDIIYIFNSGNTKVGTMLDASRSVVFGIYEKGFVYNRMGFAAAEAVTLFAIIAIVTGVQFIIEKKWVNYD
ncbi:MAG: sugar ABC transporter permease [Oscillospiraceae bacterium]|nr:sugar ABC transporter permease [Oscillospiraceae bacterium]